ncbi:serine/threonine-protein kinase pim-2-like [Symphorus nematophorus]
MAMLEELIGPESGGKSAAVTLLDWYDLDQEVILVMERPIPSVDLDTYLTNNSGPLEEDQAKYIIKQLLAAAIAMHCEGDFHRNLKSDNVLIETSSDIPRVQVTDFGCGCFEEKTPYRNFAGTFAYAPPEFFIQGTYEAAATTVWQLGELLYELLDGYVMFITSKCLHTKMKFNRKIKELDVSQDCQDLLLTFLAVNPKERFTLEQMQMHPWFTKSCKTQTPNTTH